MPVSEVTLYKKLETLGHKHFCCNRECRQVFQCLAVPFLRRCPTPRQNGRCGRCRGLAVPIWYPMSEPIECCRDNAYQVVDRDELLAYRLAGTGPWFKCKTCARCNGWPQGYKPDTTEEKK